MQPQVAQIGFMRIPVPPTMGILRCQICGADIGRFDPAKLALPLTADMFEPIGAGFPHPFRFDSRFAESLSWVNASCPVCRKRPFLERDVIMTPAGKFKVGDLMVPQRITSEQKQARKNQEEITRLWLEQAIDTDEEITMSDLQAMYPGKPQSELNQLMIDMMWEENEAEGSEGKEVQTQEQAVSAEGPKGKRRGRPRRNILAIITGEGARP